MVFPEFVQKLSKRRLIIALPILGGALAVLGLVVVGVTRRDQLAKPLLVLSAPGGDAVVGLALSRDGTKLAGAYRNGTIGIWVIPSGKLLAVVIARGLSEWHPIALSPSANVLAAVTGGH